jgi:ABC-2 type transport system ATP-binding protein
MQNAVEMRDVTRRQGPFRLGPISLDIPAGCIFGLIGPNGAGKTTLLDLICGLGRQEAGTITVLGMDLTRHEVAVKQRLAYAGPETSYAPWGRIGRLIDFVSGFYPDWDDAKCARLLEAFGLQRSQSIPALSFGGASKLGLVLALSRDPQLIVLDEPTTGLDPVARRVLYAELLHVMQRQDRTIVIATHLLSDLERFADRIALVHRGRLQLEGDMATLAERYAQIDVALSAHAAASSLPGLTLLAQSGARARYLADCTLLAPGWESGLPGEIVGRKSLALEELYLALESPAPMAELVA